MNDGFYRQNYGVDFVDALKEDRKSVFTTDTLRSLILVLLSAGLIWAYLKGRLKDNLLIVAFAILLLFDLVSVDRRYVNNEDFVSSIKMKKPFEADAVDQAILEDKSYYRVYDLVSGPSKASYFHNSMNGYNAAELKRYREVFDFYISKNNMNVLNMFNTKYIIAQGEKGDTFPYTNKEANGAAWFVKELKKVDSANNEIKALDSLDNKHVAVFAKADDALVPTETKQFTVDSLAHIKIVAHQPNYLKYHSNNSKNGFAVFSEVYYGNGWKTFIDGEETKHIRVNYTLRGLEIPSGEHNIEFKFDPDVVKTGSTIALASSVLFGLLLLGGLFFGLKKE